MPKFTRKRGGAHSLPAHKLRTRSRKVLVGRPPRGSTVPDTLANMGITFSRSRLPPNTKKTRTRQPSSRAAQLAIAKISRQLANAHKKTATPTNKEQEKLLAKELATLQKLRKKKLLGIASKKLPVVRSSYLDPLTTEKRKQEERNMSEYLNAKKELREMNSRVTRRGKNRGNVPNFGKLKLGAPLSPIKENNVM